MEDHLWLPVIEPCRKCNTSVIAGYYVDDDGDVAGWSVRPLGQCHNPDRCGDKVNGLWPGDLEDMLAAL